MRNSIARTAPIAYLFADHAVSASTVYLIRSLGTVYGVAITSAIVQTTLSVRLPDALGEISDKWRVRPFSLQWLFLCVPEIRDRRDTYCRSRHRLSTRFDIQFQPSETSPRMYNSRHGWCTTTGSATRLRRPRLSLLPPCALRSSLGRGVFEAQSDWLDGAVQMPEIWGNEAGAVTKRRSTGKGLEITKRHQVSDKRTICAVSSGVTAVSLGSTVNMGPWKPLIAIFSSSCGRVRLRTELGSLAVQ